MSELNYKEIITDGLSFVFGTFLYALCFNMFLTPNSLVVSGFSGVAIVLEKLYGWNPTTFIWIMNIILLIVGFIFLGWQKTKNNIIGSFLYPFMVTISLPISTFLSEHIIGDDFYLVLLFAVIVYGVSSGLIYRSGFTTGGSDIIMQIINKYCKISESQAMLAANALIIVLGMFVFGIDKGVYSFIILICSTYFVDKIMFGISDSKVFYIHSKKQKQIEEIILKDLETGFTIIPTKGGYTEKASSIIMCVVSNNDYYIFKQKILEVDPEAFIVIDSCYEVNGGVKRTKGVFL